MMRGLLRSKGEARCFHLCVNSAVPQHISGEGNRETCLLCSPWISTSIGSSAVIPQKGYSRSLMTSTWSVVLIAFGKFTRTFEPNCGQRQDPSVESRRSGTRWLGEARCRSSRTEREAVVWRGNSFPSDRWDFRQGQLGGSNTSAISNPLGCCCCSAPLLERTTHSGRCTRMPHSLWQHAMTSL